MKEKLRQFMVGRYGADQMGRATWIASFICLILSLLLSGVPVAGTIFTFLGLAGIVYSYFRMFSRNIPARYEENQRYLEKTAGIRRRLNREKYLMNERKTNHIFTCPGCHAKLRVPKGKGKIELTCPKCQTRFVKRS